MGSFVDDVARRDELGRGFRRLRRKERTVIALSYYLDLPTADAAADMGMRETTYRYANEEIPPSEGLDGIAACRFFASAPFEVQPNAGLPPSVAIGFQRVADEPPAGGTLIRTETMTVDGRQATVREFEAESGGFLPPGTLIYEYLVPLDGGDVLVVSTDSSRDGDYEQHREVLDLMMRTLSLGS